MPFTAAPMPCSRTPKKTLRPACSFVKRSLFGKIVFVDSVRSAAPPTIVGVCASNAAMTLPPAPRVAVFVPASNVGSTARRSVSGRPLQPLSHSAARSACSLCQRSKRSCHSACASAPRSGAKAS
jgi:hypothetical protein